MAAEWFYLTNGQQTGPVELHALREMLGTGSLSRGDLVFGPGTTEWTPAARVPALSDSIAGSTPAGSYQPAAALLPYRGIETATTGLSEIATDMLRKTKPWVRFMAIITFILAGLMVLGGISMTFMSMMMRAGGRRAALPPWLGAIYIVMAAIYIVPGVLLNRYASSIARLMQNQRMIDVEDALGAQKSFWKFAGIMTIVVIVLYVVFIAAAVLFGILK